MSTTLISGGTIVSAVGRHDGDVLIDGEKVVAILAPGQAAAMGAVSPNRTIDATGKYVVPGGVDVHTHMQLPFGGTEASDTFETGTRAAAWGGVTTIVDFAVQHTGETSTTVSRHGTTRPRVSARSTTASTRSSAASTRSRSRR